MTARALTRLNIVLAAVLVVVLIVLLAMTIGRTHVLPGTTASARAQDQNQQVSAAASTATSAFLEVDYKRMDPLLDRVLGLSTGSFRTQYAGAKASLKQYAAEAQAVSTVNIRSVGVSDISGNTATVFVAADTVLRNKSTTKVAASRSCPHAGAVCRYYRFKVTLTQVGGAWKLSGMDGVS